MQVGYLFLGWMLMLGINFLNASNEDMPEFLSAHEAGSWKLGRELRNGDQRTAIYVPRNETIEDWNEVVGMHTHVGINPGGKDFEDYFFSLTSRLFPQDIVNYRMIKREEGDLFAEWWVNGHSLNRQHGWIRVIDSPHGVIAVQYSTKRIEQVEKARKVWESLLGKFNHSELIFHFFATQHS